jgi:hypothetical protein
LPSFLPFPLPSFLPSFPLPSFHPFTILPSFCYVPPLCVFKETTPIKSVSVPKKVNSGRKKIPRCAVDHYYHLHYNEVDGFDRTLCPAAHTWKGSDSHNVFFTTPNRGLGRRYMLCWCVRCSLAKYSECLSCSTVGRREWQNGTVM